MGPGTLEDDTQTDGPPSSSSGVEHESRQLGTRPRILVIDDEHIITRVVERILSRHYAVTCCQSATEALLEIEREPDVILCDLMMPVLSGIQLHSQLSQRRPDLAARMVFVTGATTGGSGRAFLARVPNLRLGKPFSATELRSAVSEQLARTQASTAK